MNSSVSSAQDSVLAFLASESGSRSIDSMDGDISSSDEGEMISTL